MAMNEKQIKAMLGKLTGSELACLITSVNALQALKKSYGKTPPHTLDLCNKLKVMSTELANIIINIVNGQPSQGKSSVSFIDLMALIFVLYSDVVEIIDLRKLDL